MAEEESELAELGELAGFTAAPAIVSDSDQSPGRTTNHLKSGYIPAPHAPRAQSAKYISLSAHQHGWASIPRCIYVFDGFSGQS
jgi:hypothetical protein